MKQVRRSILYAIAGYFALTCTVSVYRAIHRFTDPFPYWMTEADQWYEELLQAILQAIGLVACIAFDIRRSRNVRRGITASSTYWRDRPELRFVLYSWAALLFLSLPIGAYKAFVAAHDPQSPTWSNTFWSVFPYGYLLYAAAGGFAAQPSPVIYNDRGPSKREYFVPSAVTTSAPPLTVARNAEQSRQKRK
jgi:hypothetical protein